MILNKFMLPLGGNGAEPQVFRYFLLSILFTISISNYKLQCIKILKSLLGKVRHLVVVHLVPE